MRLKSQLEDPVLDQGHGQVLFDLYGFDFRGSQMTPVGPSLPHPDLSSLSPPHNIRVIGGPWFAISVALLEGYNFLL